MILACYLRISFILASLIPTVNSIEETLIVLPDGFSYSRKTFHALTSYKSGGRINFKPWLSFEEAHNGPDLAIVPNFDNGGSFQAELIKSDWFLKQRDATSIPIDNSGPSVTIKKENCLLDYSSLDFESASQDKRTKIFSKTCQWTDLQLVPGKWYRFKVWRQSGETDETNRQLLVHFWRQIEPAFDPDRLGITVVPLRTKELGKTLEIRLDPAKIGPIWNSLLGGDDGAVVVNLKDGAQPTITKTITALDSKQPQPKVVFDHLIAGHCYVVEVMSSVENILSFNRTWFNVRTPAVGLNLTLLHADRNSALVGLTFQLDGSGPTDEVDSSCTTILTSAPALPDNPEIDGGKTDVSSLTKYHFIPGGVKDGQDPNDPTAKIKPLHVYLLQPSTKYVLGGITQCGSLTDVCRLQKTRVKMLVFETTAAD